MKYPIAQTSTLQISLNSILTQICKELVSQSTTIKTDRSPACNKRFAKKRVYWLHESCGFNKKLLQFDTFWLRITLLRKALNRYKQGYDQRNTLDIWTNKRQKPSHKVNREALPSTTYAQCLTIAIFSTRKFNIFTVLD